MADVALGVQPLGPSCKLFLAPVPCASHPLPAAGRLTVHKSRGGNRCFQILGSRHLKLDGFNDIAHRNFPTMLECKLSPEDAGFAQLGEGESFGLLDGGFKFLSREDRARSQLVLAEQAHPLFLCALPFHRKGAAKVFEDHERRSIAGSLFDGVVPRPTATDAILAGPSWSDMHCKADDWTEHSVFGLSRVSEDRGDRLDIQFITSGMKTILKTAEFRPALSLPDFNFPKAKGESRTPQFKVERPPRRPPLDFDHLVGCVRIGGRQVRPI